MGNKRCTPSPAIVLPGFALTWCSEDCVQKSEWGVALRTVGRRVSVDRLPQGRLSVCEETGYLVSRAFNLHLKILNRSKTTASRSFLSLLWQRPTFLTLPPCIALLTLEEASLASGENFTTKLSCQTAFLAHRTHFPRSRKKYFLFRGNLWSFSGLGPSDSWKCVDSPVSVWWVFVFVSPFK